MANGVDLNLLRVFAAVDAERNVSRAASKIGLTQPAMSNALSRLRRVCDDPLFVRTPSGMEPTALALEMAAAVHEALAHFERAFGGPGEFNPQRVIRRFRVLMSDAGQIVVLPTLMRALSLSAPGITIEAVQIPREQVVESLQNGSADIAISHLSSLRAGIYQEPLFDDSYCCVASAKHPVLRGSISAQQFASAKHVAIASGNAEALVERTLSKKRLTRDIALIVTQYHIAIEVVRATRLVATVPLRSVRSRTDVQVMAHPLSIPKAQIRVFWHRRVHNDPANQWLRKFLRETLVPKNETSPAPEKKSE